MSDPRLAKKFAVRWAGQLIIGERLTRLESEIGSLLEQAVREERERIEGEVKDEFDGILYTLKPFRSDWVKKVVANASASCLRRIKGEADRG